MPGSTQATDLQPPSWRRIGRYELGPRLAAGGMAELYVARATGVHGFQKYVALKRILPRFTDEREFVEMFLDEARLAAQLDHPNVVHVHDIGEDDDGPFFTMDYIHGQNLLAIIRRQRTRGSFLPWDAFIALGSAAAAGLHHAHERRGFDGKPLGIIHRDVSPTNVIVTYEGAVKIVDFGIAKASTSRHSTRPSVRKGKMAYMSPEQCKGEALDRRSDVFALGVVLYELCTLARAFHAEGEFAVMNQIVNHDLPPASSRRADVPAELDRILARALHRDPDLRYGSARELQRELDEFAVDQGLLATPEALAAVMEELFGSAPYPWESATDEGSTETIDGPPEHDTDATASKPTAAKPTAPTSVTNAKPAPSGKPEESVETGPEPVAPRAGRRRAWALGGLAVGMMASLAWIAVPRGEAASPGSPLDRRSDDPSEDAAPGEGKEAEPPAAASASESIVPPVPAASTASAANPTSDAPAPPISTPAPVTDTTLPDASAPASSTVEPTPSSKSGRRTGKTTRPRNPSTTDDPEPAPALPAPFDPDAPAPRVR